MTTIKTDVIIVGAGPTGLSLACQLVRYGIDFVIVEKNESITPFSKAIGVQARTLEIYEQMGLSTPAIEQGTITEKVRLLAGGHVRGQIPLSDFGRGLSPYPFILMLEQSKNEELLYGYLVNHGKEVRWQTELEDFTQNDEGVTAFIRSADDDAATVIGKYLVGCDGASSKVRHELGLSFSGSTFERLFYVADARVKWDLPHDGIQVCLARDVFTAFFPMKGDERYRIVGTFPESANKKEGEILYEEIEEQVKTEVQIPLDISDVRWFSLYKVHSRRVNKFSEGRCFVAGDAAHIHSPAGAQGMNTGIQDAYNLAWKLAYVVKGHAGSKLLETYNEERLANAKRLLETTDRMFELAAGPHWLLSFVRTTIFPRVAGFAVNFGPIRKQFFPLISQTGITYSKFLLSDHSGDQSFKVKAGDRMPYFLTEGRNVYEKLVEPRFHLLFVARDKDYEELKRDFQSDYGEVADQHVIKFDEQVEAIFGTEKPFVVLLRPDNYIALISSDISLARIKAYFSRLNLKNL